MCILFTCLLILLYNGRRGKLKLKRFFYVFYPLHITILYLFRLLLEKSMITRSRDFDLPGHWPPEKTCAAHNKVLRMNSIMRRTQFVKR